jgi:hypothetical protein
MGKAGAILCGVEGYVMAIMNIRLTPVFYAASGGEFNPKRLKFRFRSSSCKRK